MERSDMFKALSVETRLQIIELLKAKGSLGVNQIAKRLGMTPAAVSQHMKILRLAGLVRFKRKGVRVPYSVDLSALENVGRLLNEICLRRFPVAAPLRKNPKRRVRRCAAKKAVRAKAARRKS